MKKKYINQNLKKQFFLWIGLLFFTSCKDLHHSSNFDKNSIKNEALIGEHFSQNFILRDLSGKVIHPLSQGGQESIYPLIPGKYKLSSFVASKEQFYDFEIKQKESFSISRRSKRFVPVIVFVGVMLVGGSVYAGLASKEESPNRYLQPSSSVVTVARAPNQTNIEQGAFAASRSQLSLLSVGRECMDMQISLLKDKLNQLRNKINDLENRRNEALNRSGLEEEDIEFLQEEMQIILDSLREKLNQIQSLETSNQIDIKLKIDQLALLERSINGQDANFSSRMETFQGENSIEER